MTDIVNSNLQKFYLDLDTSLRNLIQERTDKFDMQSIVPIVVDLMEICAKFYSLSGEEKKKIILQVLKDYVLQNENLNKVLQKEMFDFCEFTLPVLIDYFVLASKKKFKFKTIQKVSTLCCPFLKTNF